jgi:4-hydroxybenzoate polyprenyltransferase
MNKYLSLVKFSHTIFAMPFALIGFFMGIKNGYEFSWLLLALIIICMIFARNSAMAFNRLIDADIDSKNKRTASREIPAGIITKKNAILFIGINSGAFIGTTFFINHLCFYLSPIALALILFYSYTKRFTSLCHIVLGISLAIAPTGAYLAVSSQFTLEVIYLSIMVLCWVSGFDILYSLQDIDFDKSQDLNSIPSYFGVKKSIRISQALHFISALTIIYIGHKYAYGNIYTVGGILFILALITQHTLIKNKGLKAINLAFFTVNGIASISFAVFTIIDFLFR